MKDYRGHRLNKKQAEALSSVIETMNDLIDKEEDGYAADTADSLIQDVENFLYELGAVKEKIFE